ncbi:MAG TPA: DUF3566 domain-containing protein [Acidobacteriota bacterium]|nr:DUF3566 domain-containing protein [Acidobacteriota bacterium]
MRYELKTIGIWPLVKVSFFLNLVLGFLYGLVNAFIMSMILAIAPSLPFASGLEFDPAEISLAFLFLLFPIFCALGGAVFLTLFCAVVALIYNAVARLLGGYEFDLAAVTEMVGVRSVPRPPMAPGPAAGPYVPPPYTPPPPSGDYPRTREPGDNPPGTDSH